MHYIHRTLAIIDTYSVRRSAFWGLLSICVLSVALYMIFVTSIAFYAGEHKHFSYDLARTQTEVSTLETQYMKLAGEVDASYAYAHGYEDASEVTYVRRGTLVRNTGTQSDI